MIVVGQVSSSEEAREIKYITEISRVMNRIRSLALQTRTKNEDNEI